jgi:hypothetical protein
MLPLAQIVDTDALLSVVVASLAGGAGLTGGFSIAILAATRAAELRRRGDAVRATMLVAVALLAGAACVALIAFGIYLIAS